MTPPKHIKGRAQARAERRLLRLTQPMTVPGVGAELTGLLSKLGLIFDTHFCCNVRGTRTEIGIRTERKGVSFSLGCFARRTGKKEEKFEFNPSGLVLVWLWSCLAVVVSSGAYRRLIGQHGTGCTNQNETLCGYN